MVPGHVHDHPGVLRHGKDLLQVPDNSLIPGEGFQYFRRHLLPVQGHKPLKSRLEIRPFVLDHPPDEASLEDTAGQLGQITVIASGLQFVAPGDRRQQGIQGICSALVIDRLVVDSGERHQAVSGYLVVGMAWRGSL